MRESLSFVSVSVAYPADAVGGPTSPVFVTVNVVGSVFGDSLALRVEHAPSRGNTSVAPSA